MNPLVNWLPDWKGALNNFYDERVKNTLENKSQEYKELLEKHFQHFQQTQQALLAIALGTFSLIAIAYFWPN